MNKKLFFNAFIKYLLGVLIIGVLLFVPAGTFKYFNAWLFMGLLFIPMLIAGIVLMIKNPELLKIRLDIKEKERDQKWVLVCSGLMFIIGFIVAGLNFKYKWIVLSNTIVIVSSIAFILAYILYAEVLRENIFLSRTIKVEKNQKVISTGLYRFVRHPMYAATIILFLSIQLILGSIYSFILFLLYPFVIEKRIENEELILEKELNGYSDYKKKVKYKVFPFIW